MNETEIKTNRSKIGLLSIIFIIIFCILVVGAISFFSGFKDRGKVKTADKSRQVVVAEQLPAGLPADLPYLATGIPVQNFTTLSGKDQIGSRKVLVTNPVAEIKTAYLDYFAKFGWEIVTDFSETGREVLSASKNDQNLTVSIKDSGGKSLLELTSLQSK
jgi:hypothetical protein